MGGGGGPTDPNASLLDVLVFPRHVLPIFKLFIVAVASKNIGRVITRLSKKTPLELPLITGFLITGMVCGPFVLGIIDANDVIDLKFTDDICLSFIAFAAGSEMYMKDMTGRLTTIRKIVTALIISVFAVGTIVMYLLGDWVPFMSGMSMSGKWGQALLSAAILLARSPSSAIAIVNELRAKGQFVQTTLGVVMIIDVATIVLFSASAQVARTLTSGDEFSADFVGWIFAQLSLSVVAGIVLWGILNLMFTVTEHCPCLADCLRAMGFQTIDLRAFCTLVIGWGVFISAKTIQHYSQHHLLEPLLVCMIGGFLICNYTSHRISFAHVLEFAGPEVYTIFFTYTGLSLYLDVFISRIKYACVIFLVRIASLIMGTLGGGIWARDNWDHTKISWMAYITQAGVGLGLAKQVGAEFGEWGPDFSTTMISVIVMNQILGPPFMKWAIYHVGEAHQGGKLSEFEVEIELHDDDLNDTADDADDDIDDDELLEDLPLQSGKTPFKAKKAGGDNDNDSPTDPMSHPSLGTHTAADGSVHSAFADADAEKEETKRQLLLRRTERKRRMAEVKRAARMQQLQQLGQMVMVRRNNIEDEQLSLVPWWMDDSDESDNANPAEYQPQSQQMMRRSISARGARAAPMAAAMPGGGRYNGPVPPSAVQPQQPMHQMQMQRWGAPALPTIMDTSVDSHNSQLTASPAELIQAINANTQAVLAIATANSTSTSTNSHQRVAAAPPAGGVVAMQTAVAAPYTAPVTRRARLYTPVPVTPTVTLIERDGGHSGNDSEGSPGMRRLLLSPRPSHAGRRWNGSNRRPSASGSNNNTSGRSWWSSMFGGGGGGGGGGGRGYTPRPGATMPVPTPAQPSRNTLDMYMQQERLPHLNGNGQRQHNGNGQTRNVRLQMNIHEV